MKKYSLITAFFCILLSSCKYDDTELRNNIVDLENRVAELEEICEQINEQIESLRTLVNAIDSRDYILSYRELDDKSGYKINFQKLGSITILHGNDGEDGEDGKDGKDAPVIGIDIYDGVYCWTITIDNETTWLKDSNQNPIRVTGKDGINGIDGNTPILGIDDEGYWTVDYGNDSDPQRLANSDGEEIIAIVSKNSDSGISTLHYIEEDEDNVYFIFQNTEPVIIPKYKPLNVVFSVTEPTPVISDGTYTIQYTILGGDPEYTEIETVAQDGYRATVNKTTYSTGTITITTPGVVVDSKVLVFISNGEDKTIMRTISFAEGIMTIENPYYNLTYQAEVVEIPISTNFSYSIDISAEAKDWISIAPGTRGTMRNEMLRLSIKENTGNTRYATVNIIDGDNNIIESLSFRQGRKLVEVHVETKGTLADLLGADEIATIVELKITGEIDDIDQITIRSLPKLVAIDMTGLRNTTLLDGLFSDMSNIIEIYLPNVLELIGNNMFLNCSSLQQISVPENVIRIGSSAFLGCKSLNSVDFVGNAVTEIGEKVFYMCSSLKSVKIGSNAELIGNSSFESSGLEEIIFEEESKLQYISGRLFYNTQLKNINLPTGIRYLSSSAFYNTKLESIIIPANVTSVGSETFAECKSLKEVQFAFGSQLTTIGMRTFQNCTSLELFDAWECVLLSEINVNAFDNAFRVLQIFSIGATTPPSVAPYGFPLSFSNFIILRVPIEAVALYKEEAPWNRFSVSGVENYL